VIFGQEPQTPRRARKYSNGIRLYRRSVINDMPGTVNRSVFFAGAEMTLSRCNLAMENPTFRFLAVVELVNVADVSVQLRA